MTDTDPATDYTTHHDKAAQMLGNALLQSEPEGARNRAVSAAGVHATLALAAAVREQRQVTLGEYTEPIDLLPAEPAPARYVYVASSWRNTFQLYVVEALRHAGIGVYDFKHPDNHGTGFHWSEVGLPAGNEPTPVVPYLDALEHPRSIAGYDSDFAAMERADTFVLVLPCGRSAHLELGWAVGAGKRTAILLDDPTTPELMYRMVDYLATNVEELLDWLQA